MFTSQLFPIDGPNKGYIMASIYIYTHMYMYIYFFVKYHRSGPKLSNAYRQKSAWGFNPGKLPTRKIPHEKYTVYHAVDGRNPAPVDRCFIPSLIGSQPSKVVQDFFRPPYVGLLMLTNVYHFCYLPSISTKSWKIHHVC